MELLNGDENQEEKKNESRVGPPGRIKHIVESFQGYVFIN